MSAHETHALTQREARFFDEKALLYRFLRRLIIRSVAPFKRYGELYELVDPHDKHVLEYGSGDSFLTPLLLERGARFVTGFDISRTEVNEAQQRAAQAGLTSCTRFLVADAHATGFADGEFDVVVGSSILHHLDLEASLVELKRILKPDGRAVFAEPLAGNPFIRLGRKLTPAARTPDEHPITTADWDLCRRIFPRFTHIEVEFLSTLVMPLSVVMPHSWLRPLAGPLARRDDQLMCRHPSLRQYARLTFLIFDA
jgi:SAM-dependent methyltransferase